MQKHEHFNIIFDGFILNIFEKRTELFLVWSDFYRHKQNVMKSSSIEDSIFSYRISHKNGIFTLASSLNIDEKVLAVASVLIYVISASFVVFYFYFFRPRLNPEC